jgi:hypothetical protein
MTIEPTDAEIEVMALALDPGAFETVPDGRFLYPELVRNPARDQARAAFASLPPSIQRVPEGWVCVPLSGLRRARDAMSNVEALSSRTAAAQNRKWWEGEKAALSAMIASPSPDPVKGEEG